MTETPDKFSILSRRPISAWPYPRIIVGVPQERSMGHADEVFYNFWAIASQGVPIIKIPYGRIDLTRNKMAIALLKTNFTHLLMLDIDHMHPPDIVQRLAGWVIANPNIKVVGGMNFRRGEPYDPCCFLRGEDGGLYPPAAEWHEGLLKVDVIGTGSILIAKEVFEIIPPPWFFNYYDRVWEDEWPGEDISFSDLCTANGIDLYVDTTTTSPHMIDAWVDENTWAEYVKANPDMVVTMEEFERQNEKLARAKG
jgi:hypothetical protein